MSRIRSKRRNYRNAEDVNDVKNFNDNNDVNDVNDVNNMNITKDISNSSYKNNKENTYGHDLTIYQLFDIDDNKLVPLYEKSFYTKEDIKDFITRNANSIKSIKQISLGDVILFHNDSLYKADTNADNAIIDAMNTFKIGVFNGIVYNVDNEVSICSVIPLTDEFGNYIKLSTDKDEFATIDLVVNNAKNLRANYPHSVEILNSDIYYSLDSSENINSYDSMSIVSSMLDYVNESYEDLDEVYNDLDNSESSGITEVIFEDDEDNDPNIFDEGNVSDNHPDDILPALQNKFKDYEREVNKSLSNPNASADFDNGMNNTNKTNNMMDFPEQNKEAKSSSTSEVISVTKDQSSTLDDIVSKEVDIACKYMSTKLDINSFVSNAESKTSEELVHDLKALMYYLHKGLERERLFTPTWFATVRDIRNVAILMSAASHVK